MKVFQIISIVAITMITFSGCDLSKVFTSSTDIPQQVTGTWEGEMEVDGFLGKNETMPVMVHINFKDTPYFIQFKVGSKELSKFEIEKITIHKDDNALQYFIKDSKNPAYIILVNSKNIQLKSKDTLNLKKIISVY